MTHEDVSPGLKMALGITIGLYVVGIYALGLFAQRRIHNATDFIVAGRRLPLSLAWMTLMATWFGAGAILTATNTVRDEGLPGAAMDPLGAGVCLLLAGLIIARPLWRMGLLTIGDFFRRKFGPAAELLSALILVPSYFGWIAAQFVALAEMLHLFFGLDLATGIFIVAMIGMGYTLLGGMWSVTLTDAVQLGLVMLGLVYLGWTVFSQVGSGSVVAGVETLIRETPDEMLAMVPMETATIFLGWLGVFFAGALGNLPGQDLTQRIFAAKSERVAQHACYIAGGMYLLFGLFPLGMGLLANVIWKDSNASSILPAMAHAFLSPTAAVIFTLVLMSAVLSTIDSAILSPASVLSQNVFPRLGLRRFSMLAVNRVAVVLVTAASLGMAYAGKTAYELLETAYEMIQVSLFVPLVLGIYLPPVSGMPAIACMISGMGLWFLHKALGWDYFFQPWLASPAEIGEDTALDKIAGLPMGLAITAVGLVIYLAWHLTLRFSGRLPRIDEELSLSTDSNGMAIDLQTEA